MAVLRFSADAGRDTKENVRAPLVETPRSSIQQIILQAKYRVTGVDTAHARLLLLRFDRRHRRQAVRGRTTFTRSRPMSGFVMSFFVIYFTVITFYEQYKKL